jgi:pimeloyl-ACP methyl ester carboxylesterase
MTRAQGPDSSLEYRSFGAAGAARVVFVLRLGEVSTLDPDPAVTSAHDVRIVAVQLDAAETDDPPTFGGETAAESAADALAVLVVREGDGAPVGLVGEREVGLLAIALAARAADRIDRLALVGVAAPESPLTGDLLTEKLGAITADTLLVDADADALSSAAQWYAERLRNASVDVVALRSDGDGDPRVSVGDAWRQVLDHVAPGAARR